MIRTCLLIFQAIKDLSCWVSVAHCVIPVLRQVRLSSLVYTKNKQNKCPHIFPTSHRTTTSHLTKNRAAFHQATVDAYEPQQTLKPAYICYKFRPINGEVVMCSFQCNVLESHFCSRVFLHRNPS